MDILILAWLYVFVGIGGLFMVYLVYEVNRISELMIKDSERFDIRLRSWREDVAVPVLIEH